MFLWYWCYLPHTLRYSVSPSILAGSPRLKSLSLQTRRQSVRQGSCKFTPWSSSEAGPCLPPAFPQCACCPALSQCGCLPGIPPVQCPSTRQEPPHSRPGPTAAKLLYQARESSLVPRCLHPVQSLQKLFMKPLLLSSVETFYKFDLKEVLLKNPAYGRHWISRPMRILEPFFSSILIFYFFGWVEKFVWPHPRHSGPWSPN